MQIDEDVWDDGPNEGNILPEPPAHLPTCFPTCSPTTSVQTAGGILRPLILDTEISQGSLQSYEQLSQTRFDDEINAEDPESGSPVLSAFSHGSISRNAPRLRSVSQSRPNLLHAGMTAHERELVRKAAACREDDIQRLNNQISKLEGEIQDLRVQLCRSRNELETEQMKFSRARANNVTNSIRTKLEMDQRTRRFTREKDELMKENSRRSRRIQELKQENTRHGQSVHELEQENARQGQRLHELEKTISPLEKALEELAADGAVLTEENIRCSQRIVELGRENSRRKQFAGELEQEVTRRSQRIRDLEQTVAPLEKVLVELAAAEAECYALRSELRSAPASKLETRSTSLVSDLAPDSRSPHENTGTQQMSRSQMVQSELAFRYSHSSCDLEPVISATHLYDAIQGARCESEGSARTMSAKRRSRPRAGIAKKSAPSAYAGLR